MVRVAIYPPPREDLPYLVAAFAENADAKIVEAQSRDHAREIAIDIKSRVRSRQRSPAEG